MAYHTQKCGDCSLCCTLLGIKEYRKPPNQPCVHCPTGAGGCQIYLQRPKSCRRFECGYLTAPLPVEYRPDHIHIIVTGEDKRLQVQFIDVDPKFPNALETVYGRRLINMMQISGFRDIVVTTGGRMRMISDNPVRAAFVLHELERSRSPTRR